jgi:hypothetical protein
VLLTGRPSTLAVLIVGLNDIVACFPWGESQKVEPQWGRCPIATNYSSAPNFTPTPVKRRVLIIMMPPSTFIAGVRAQPFSNRALEYCLSPRRSGQGSEHHNGGRVAQGCGFPRGDCRRTEGPEQDAGLMLSEQRFGGAPSSYLSIPPSLIPLFSSYICL